MSQAVGHVLFDYSARDSDELSIFRGETVTVIETYDDGWWLVGNSRDNGLVPSNYLSVEPQLDAVNNTNRSSELNLSNSHNNKGEVVSGLEKTSKASPRGQANHGKPTELNRLKDMREQAETRINALRTAVTNYETETLKKKDDTPSERATALSVGKNIANTPQHQRQHKLDLSVDETVPSMNVRQPEKPKVKKAAGGAASNRMIEHPVPEMHNSPATRPGEPANGKFPQVALDQNSLNFISKIINERLEKEFSVRDERIIDQVKSLLISKSGGAGDSNIKPSSINNRNRSESKESKDGRESRSISPTKSKIPRMNLPKIAPAKVSEKLEQITPSQSVIHSTGSAPASSSAENRLPLMLKNNSSVSVASSSGEKAAPKKTKPKNSAIPESDSKPSRVAHPVATESKKQEKQHEKRLESQEAKISVVDELTKGIQYPQCRSIVYPPTNNYSHALNTGQPSSTLALQHIYGCNSSPSTRGTRIQVLKDNRVLFAAASVLVCMDGNTRKQSFFTQHTSEVTCFALHPNRQTVASAGVSAEELVIYLWDSKIATAVNSDKRDTVIRRLEVPQGVRSINCLSFSADGLFLVALVIDDSHSLLIYDCLSGSLVVGVKAGQMDVSEVLFNPYAYSTSEQYEDTTVGCYTLVSRSKQIKVWTFCVYVDEDSQQLCYSLEGSVVASSTVTTPSAAEHPNITCVTCVDDSQMCYDEQSDSRYRHPQSRVFAGTSAGSVVIFQQLEDETTDVGHVMWQPRGKMVSVVTDVHDSPLLDISYFCSGHNPDAQNYLLYERILTSGADCSLNLWAMNRSEDKQTLPLDHIFAFELESKEAVQSVAWDVLGANMTMCTASHSIVNVTVINDEGADSETITVSSEDVLTCHSGKIKRIAVNPVLQSLFATIGSDKTVRLWEATASRQVGVLTLPFIATAVSFSADGKSLAIGNDKGELSIYTSNEFSALLSQNKKKILSMLGAPIVALSLNTWVVSMKRNVTVQNSNISPKKKSHASSAKQCDIMDIRFSPSGDVVAVGCKDNLVHILSVKNGYKHSAVCRGHSSYIKNIDFSTDGTVFQSTDAAREILFWDAVSGQQLTNAAEFRDVQWSSWSCVYGWPVHGAFNDEEGRSTVDGDVLCVNRSADSRLLITGSSQNSLKLFNFPCVANSIPSVYSGHVSSVADVAFLAGLRADEVSAVSVGSADGCIFQWRVVKQ